MIGIEEPAEGSVRGFFFGAWLPQKVACYSPNGYMFKI